MCTYLRYLTLGQDMKKLNLTQSCKRTYFFFALIRRTGVSLSSCARHAYAYCTLHYSVVFTVKSGRFNSFDFLYGAQRGRSSINRVRIWFHNVGDKVPRSRVNVNGCEDLRLAAVHRSSSIADQSQ